MSIAVIIANAAIRKMLAWEFAGPLTVLSGSRIGRLLLLLVALPSGNITKRYLQVYGFLNFFFQKSTSCGFFKHHHKKSYPTNYTCFEKEKCAKNMWGGGCTPKTHNNKLACH